MINLVCVFDHSSKSALIADMGASLPYIDDSDMADLMKETLRLIEAMTEAGFAELVFEPALEEGEEWET
jgi:hypothetical protein